MSPLARRTSARPVGSGGGRGVGGRNVGTFLQRARSGRGCSTRASAGDRAVAAQGGLASLRVALFAAKGKSWCARAVRAITAAIRAEAYGFGPVETFMDRNRVDVSPCSTSENRRCGECWGGACALCPGQPVACAASRQRGPNASDPRPHSSVGCVSAQFSRRPLARR